jgi:Uma2 family endonuclease
MQPALPLLTDEFMSVEIEDVKPKTARPLPPLCQGDRLTQEEFLRRYRATPHVSHAELIEGVVYMPSPVSATEHGEPHASLLTWIGVYAARTAGVVAGDNSTLRLDTDNAPQPDGYLRLLPECGGQVRVTDGYLEGAPELVAEISASTASYDLHDKLNAYRRNGVREYVVWRVWDQAIDWFVLNEGRYERLAVRDDAIFRSRVFPGLWLDARALLKRDMGQVLQTLETGLASLEHNTFVVRNGKTHD